MLVIAVTGGIGSGKSTVADQFRARGVPVIDTDAIAHELVEPGEPLLERIIDEFGNDFLDAQGRLNRRALRELIFNDDAARIKLEQMSHPLIHAQVVARLKEIHAPYCLLIIPLLARSRQAYPYDRVLLVDAPEESRVQRGSQRDGQDPESIRRIIASQASGAELANIADDVLDNSGDLEQLRDEVDRLHRQYLRLANATN
jgi:dephospho-CoA kinase